MRNNGCCSTAAFTLYHILTAHSERKLVNVEEIRNPFILRLEYTYRLACRVLLNNRPISVVKPFNEPDQDPMIMSNRSLAGADFTIEDDDFIGARLNTMSVEWRRRKKERTYVSWSRWRRPLVLCICHDCLIFTTLGWGWKVWWHSRLRVWALDAWARRRVLGPSAG